MNKLLLLIVLCGLVGCAMRPAGRSDLSPSEKYDLFRMEHDIRYRDEQLRGTPNERQLNDAMRGDPRRSDTW